MPEEILPSEMYWFIFNQDTVDRVINDLMTNGLQGQRQPVGEGDHLCAGTRNHAQFLSTGSTPSTRV